MNYNKVILAGHLGRDVEQRSTPSGTAIASFSLAVQSGWGDNQKTAWVDVTAFGKTAELCTQYLSKGSNVLVEGELRQDTWETDSGRRSKLSVVANRVVFISTRSPESQPATVDDDDFPF